ncbi:hypothetical protein glysoja_036641, partial [Glycine soja]
WVLTCFYKILDRAHRRESWQLLKDLHSNIFLPWCIVSDFNNLFSKEDKCGRVKHPPWLFQGFREAIFVCDLQDIPLQGYHFT